jgi:phosphoribosylamine--glycine ligase
VVAANRGYPGKYESGAVIEGCEEVETGVEIFHAGTSLSPTGELLASGGRVLGVTAAADSLTTALATCYSALEIIHWPGMQFRRDIGKSKPAFETAG